MENGIEPKRTISLTWDDPWKNMRRGGRSILEGKANLCFIQTSPGPKGPGEANRNSEKQRHLKHGGNPWSPCPW